MVVKGGPGCDCCGRTHLKGPCEAAAAAVGSSVTVLLEASCCVAELTDLLPGSTYFLRVRAHNYWVSYSLRAILHLGECEGAHPSQLFH